MLDVATREYLDKFKEDIIKMLEKMEANIDRVVTLTIDNLKEEFYLQDKFENNPSIISKQELTKILKQLV